jgi:hypothetical protein
VSGDVETTEGRLIDLDHAKQTKNFCVHKLPEPDDVDIQIARLKMKKRNLLVQPDVLRGATAAWGELAAVYLEEVVETRVKYFDLTPGQGGYSCADFRWNYEVSLPIFERTSCF